MSALAPSSRRTLGPRLTFARFVSRAVMPSKIKMDPSVRWDDDTGADAPEARKIEAAAA